MPKRSKGPMSTAYRKPIVLYSDDPRASNKKELKKYKSKIGAEVIVKDAPIDNVVLEEYVAPLGESKFWFSSFAKESSTSVNLATVSDKNDAIVLSAGSGTYSNGIISRYSKDRDLLSSRSFDLSLSNLSVNPSGLIKKSNLNIVSFGNISTTPQSGYFCLHTMYGSEAILSKKIYSLPRAGANSGYTSVPDGWVPDVSVSHCAVDESGNYYIGGNHYDLAWNQSIWVTSNAGFVAKISSDGQTILWQKTLKETSIYSRLALTFGVHYYNGVVYVLSAIDGLTGGRRRMVATRFDANTGSLISSRTLGTFDYTEFCVSSFMDKSGNIYVAERVGGSFNPCIYKFNSSLSGIWATQVGRVTTVQANRIYADDDQNVYLISEQFSVGDSNDSPNFYKFDANGILLYCKRFSSNVSTKFENGMSFDNYGNPYISGSLANSIPILAHLPKDGSLTGSYSYNLYPTSTNVAISYYDVSHAVGYGVPSSYEDDIIGVGPDMLALDNLSFNISQPIYSESGVFIS